MAHSAMRIDGAVEVPTGSLFPDGFVESTSETRDLNDTFPLTQTGTEGNGMGSLRSLWKQVRKMLYADYPDLGTTWFGANVKDAVDRPDAIAKFEVALHALQDWMRTMGRTVPMVEQWNLVSEQQELHTIASNLLDENLIGDDVYTLGAADRLLTVIIKLMDSLVPPWLEDSTQPLPLPTAGKQGEFTPSQTEQLKNHFVSEYGKIKSLADEFVAVIRFITQTTQLPGLDERLVYLAGRIEAMSSVVVVVEEQNRRMQRIWHVQRDTLYKKGLPGEPHYTTYENAGGGSCGYLSLIASVGQDGITSDPALGYPASRKADPNYKGKITDSVRNKAADWLLGGASKDMTNWQYSKMMSVRQAMLHVDGNGAILAPLTEAQKVTSWKRKVTQRRRLTYWAAESDWTAIAAVFKRRIHLYNIINQDGREEGDDYIIKYCKYHDSYGHIEHRPVCIASTYGGQYKRGLDLVASVRVGQDLDRDHYCAILNTVTNPGGPTCVPWAGGYSEVDLPYEDDLVDPFGLYTSGAPPQRPTPPTDCPRPPPDFMQQFIAAYYVREKTEAHTTENARWDVQKEREATAKDNAEKEGATETEVGAYTAAKKETEKRKKEAQDAEAEMKAAEAVLVESFPLPPPLPPPTPPPIQSASDHNEELKMLKRKKAARENEEEWAKWASEKVARAVARKAAEAAKEDLVAGAGDADADEDGGGGGGGYADADAAEKEASDESSGDGSNPNPDPTIQNGVLKKGRNEPNPNEPKPNPDPNHDGTVGDGYDNGCGEGRTPVDTNQTNGQRYNYVDDYLSKYQKFFIKVKMEEAHDAFIQHMSNRQNYSTIMLMRNIDKDPSQAFNTTYKGKTKANTNLSQELVGELYGPLDAAANPTHTKNIWDGWKARVEARGTEARVAPKEPDNVLRKMLGRLFAVASFSQPDPKNFWTTLCVWWVKYKGTREYPESNEDLSSNGKLLQFEILTWYLNGRQETNKDGSAIKRIWSFLDAAVVTLTELDGPEATLLDDAEPLPVREAMEDFVTRTQGDPNTEVRMDLLRNQAVVKALIALMRNKLKVDRVSNGQDADDLNDQVVAADRAVYAVSALLQKESPRAPIEELNDEILALDTVALPLHNLWFREEYPEMGNDASTLKDLLKYHLALSRHLLINGGGLEHPDYHDAVTYWVAQADAALDIVAPPRPISIELLRKLIYSLFSANTELFSAFSWASGPADPKRQTDFHELVDKLYTRHKDIDKAAEDAKKADDDAAEAAEKAWYVAKEETKKAAAAAEAAKKEAAREEKKTKKDEASVEKAKIKAKKAADNLEKKVASERLAKAAKEKAVSEKETNKIQRDTAALEKAQAAKAEVEQAQKAFDEEKKLIANAKLTKQEQLNLKAQASAKIRLEKAADKTAQDNAEARATRMRASENSEQFGASERALNDLHEQAKAILVRVGHVDGQGGFTAKNTVLRKLVQKINKERGVPGQHAFEAAFQTWGASAKFWGKMYTELWQAVEAYKNPANNDELFNLTKKDADTVRYNREEALIGEDELFPQDSDDEAEKKVEEEEGNGEDAEDSDDSIWE